MKLTRTKALAAVASAAGLALALTGCAGDAAAPSESPAAGGDGAFPVTIEHAFGETVIEQAPERIATWGWGAADAVLALGEVPVAIPAEMYGGDENGVLPWIAEELDALGAETPALLTSGAEGQLPIEEMLAAAPDVVLAPYSGITEEEYTQLTDAGVDVVAYPEVAWSTPWRDVISIVGEALGQADEAEQVLADIDASIAEQAAAHPEFEGLSIAEVWNVAGTFYVYLPADPRVQFAEDLGFVSAESVTELDTGEATFYYTLSYEQLDKLEADVLLIYGDTEAEVDEFLASEQGQLLPQVPEGEVVKVIGQSAIASVAPPTALSLTWGMGDFIAAIEEGLAE
ncbi:ABC transporter substrate-binding protein [Microbacterium sp. MEC084]|uniref:ABC transporter substrate-binding protein n=1 Tax=Microbacterium sp. MEC084 TaxID=1963027 RepID=UPI00106FE26F|nr:ABC transporter substrate-binding protein [Microbacterium sp. MEC084]MCD1267462.1 ABC transporter substrate-binding protein [Microbacterium sp. MEC084]